MGMEEIKYNSIEEIEKATGVVIRKNISKSDFETILKIWDDISLDIQKKILYEVKNTVAVSRRIINRHKFPDIYITAINQITKPLERTDLKIEQQFDINKSVVEITKNALEAYKTDRRRSMEKAVGIAGVISGSVFAMTAAISFAASRKKSRKNEENKCMSDRKRRRDR